VDIVVLDLQVAHDISTAVENELIKQHGVYEVHVHMEPTVQYVNE